MAISKKNLVLFNGAAALLVGASLAYAVRSSLLADDVEPCTSRYAQGMRMSVERDGMPMQGADLQARLGGTDWGVLERSRVVRLKSGPAAYAVEFDLTGAKADDRDEANGREGIGFVWSPRAMGTGKAACLAYSVFMPEGFEFGAGGRLPGLMGLAADGEAPDQGSLSAISARYVWRETGAGDIYTQMPGLPEGRSIGNDRRTSILFTRGRWVSLEQEVVLNAPGRRDGLMRVWVDGDLRMEKAGLVFHGEKPVKLTGVLAEVVPIGRDVNPGAKAQKLWISPFELRWN